MSLWRKRNVQHNEHNEQKHDNLSVISIKSEDLSIKSEEAMREVQRLGQEIQPDVKQSLTTEPVAYINIEKRRLEWAYDYMSWDTPTVINLPRIPLYTQQRTWVGLTDEDDIDWEDGGNLKDLVKAIEAKLKDKNT